MKKKLLTLVISIFLLLPIIVKAEPLFLTVDRDEKTAAVGDDITFNIKLAKETEFDRIDIVYDQNVLLRKNVVLTCGAVVCPEDVIESVYGRAENIVRIKLKNGYSSLNDELKIAVTFKTLKDAETIVYAISKDDVSYPMKATIGNPNSTVACNCENPNEALEGESNYDPTEQPGGSYMIAEQTETEEEGSNLNTIIMIISLVLNGVFAVLLVVYLIKVKKKAE